MSPPSDDLDDGEIPKEAPVSRFALTGKGDKIDRWEPSTSTPRNRYSDDPKRASSSSGSRDASRSGRRSPPRDDQFGRRRPRTPPRVYDRYSMDANSGAPRARFSGPRKEPSVHDANTRADLGRLAREAEAAAYKARNTAAVKVSPAVDNSPNKTSSPRHSQRDSARSDTSRGHEGRTRSRSPIPRKPSAARPVNVLPSPGPARPVSPISARERPRLRSPQPSSNALSSATLTINAQSHLETGRMNRERDAAAHKTRISQESQTKQKMRQPNADGSERLRGSVNAVTESDAKVGEEEVATASNATESNIKIHETIIQIISSTPSLDIQVRSFRGRRRAVLTTVVSQSQGRV